MVTAVAEEFELFAVDHAADSSASRQSHTTTLLQVAPRLHRRARDLATQLQTLTGQHIAIRDGPAVITDTAA